MKLQRGRSVKLQDVNEDTVNGFYTLFNRYLFSIKQDVNFKIFRNIGTIRIRCIIFMLRYDCIVFLRELVLVGKIVKNKSALLIIRKFWVSHKVWSGFGSNIQHGKTAIFSIREKEITINISETIQNELHTCLHPG